MKKAHKRKKPVESPVLLSAGDMLKHPVYGSGIVKNIEENKVENYEFFYYADFTGKGGDGTKVWLPKEKTEKEYAVVPK